MKLLTLLDQTLSIGSLRTGICLPIGMAPYLGSSVSFSETQLYNTIPQVIERYCLEREMLQMDPALLHCLCALYCD